MYLARTSLVHPVFFMAAFPVSGLWTTDPMDTVLGRGVMGRGGGGGALMGRQGHGHSPINNTENVWESVVTNFQILK